MEPQPKAASPDVETGGKPEQEESIWKICCYWLIDVIACLGRGAVACGHGFKWTARRCCYPIKELIVYTCERWHTWYYPYKAKIPSKGNIPGFAY
mmetsp:Transcript_116992/g.372381  ORF Transcript_116992/g.372381 Transcript_116992/m.372381 type:complete len:95 (-) Transcript_116992:197-481(-)